MVKRTKQRLWKEGLQVENILADKGYSSEENYAFLEKQNLTIYIPPHGTYKGCPDGSTYNEREDHFTCPQAKVIPFRKVFLDYRTKTKKKEYRASSKLCKDCPIKATCIRKVKEKRITVTYYREEYERNDKRVYSHLGKQMKKIRQSRVEPVFGTLTQYLGMQKINVRGISGTKSACIWQQ
ncbi:transposase [Aquimarina sp. ERC-38]|uniref:transposase n=1 Tax=Aquimarina sp. ERC-38 TaxID=2949996 RepID=UPI00224637C9|nr:transposase [Aquimarina sp. ERC-38]UZO80617.1 transposase [Aquimarina sp. ERC-38]